MAESHIGSKESDHYALDEAESTLPMAWYYDRDHYERELERI